MVTFKLPSESPNTFPGVPLSGHLCCMTRGERRLYWRVESLIEAAKELPVSELDVEPLVGALGDSTWFGHAEKPTIRAILSHLERAMATDLECPLILSSDGKIMDGSHRLIAAKIKNRKTLPCVRFKSDPAPEYEEKIS